MKKIKDQINELFKNVDWKTFIFILIFTLTVTLIIPALFKTLIDNSYKIRWRIFLLNCVRLLKSGVLFLSGISILFPTIYDKWREHLQNMKIDKKDDSQGIIFNFFMVFTVIVESMLYSLFYITSSQSGDIGKFLIFIEIILFIFSIFSSAKVVGLEKDRHKESISNQRQQDFDDVKKSLINDDNGIERFGKKKA